MVADALSRKIMHITHLMIMEMELLERFKDMKLHVELGFNLITCSDFLYLVTF